MYRIKLASGEEHSYATLEAFSSAVRRGVVPSDAQIFHARASRWLEIAMHPHYQLALKSEAPSGEPPPPPVPVEPPRPSAPVRARRSGELVFIDPSEPIRATDKHPVGTVAPPTTAEPVRNTDKRPAIVPPSGAAAELLHSTDRRPAVAGPSQTAAEPVRNTDRRPAVGLHERTAAEPARNTDKRPAIQLPAQPTPEPPRITDKRPATAVTAQPATGPVPSTEPARITEARPALGAAPLPAPPPPAPAPAKAPEKPAPEPEFLVMDSGLEHPIRTSVGVKLVDASILPEVPARPAVEQVQAVPTPTPPGAPAALPEVIASMAPIEMVIPAARPRLRDEATDLESLEVDAVRSMIAAAPSHTPSAPHRRPSGANKTIRDPAARRTGLWVAAIALMAGAAVIAWRPWAGAKAAPAPAPPSTSTAVVAALPTPPTVPVTVPSMGGGPPAPQKAGGAQKPVVTPSPKPTVDSAPEIVRAVKLDFKATPVEVSVAAPVGDGSAVPARGEARASLGDLVSRYSIAQAKARQELDQKMREIGFLQILSPERLASIAGVGATRTTLAAAIDGIQRYRARLASIEQAYGDTVFKGQGAKRFSGDELRLWAGRATLVETRESAELTDMVMSQVDKTLRMLLAEGGNFELQSGELVFSNHAAATEYADAVAWLAQRLEGWAGTPETALPVTTRYLAAGLGKGLPPGRAK